MGNTPSSGSYYGSQAGPDQIKKYAYLDAEIARRYDPQIAAI